MTESARSRPDYGLDAPDVVRRLFLIGSALTTLGVILYLVLGDSTPGLSTALLNLGMWPGLTLLATSGVMVWGSRVGKFRERDRLLDGMPWRGDEQVLDVGCGHGLLLIGAARRLRTGKAIGVDLWQTEDQAGNTPDATRGNAALEGVADRVEVRDGDARKLPFADGTFDVVLSSWCLHNIYDPAGREQAVREMARVLKPGGRIAILDIRHTGQYARALRDCGWTEVCRSWPRFTFVTPTFTVRGTKPGGEAGPGKSQERPA